jgi:hypothetical protein
MVQQTCLSSCPLLSLINWHSERLNVINLFIIQLVTINKATSPTQLDKTNE